MRHFVLLFAFCTLIVNTGCEERASKIAPAEPPAIPVSKPVKKEVTDYVDFTGRTNAVQAVDIRARVTGYLTSIPFKEGAEVKNGEVLFEIDPRPYQAQLDQAASQITLNEASLKLAKVTYSRDQSINATGGAGAVSQQQLDQDHASVEEAEARLKASQASSEIYKLNVGYTKVTSPIDGQVSRYYLTVGNLVIQDQTLLTTVVSLDPMYVSFEMDEPTLLRIRRAVNEGKIQVPQQGQLTFLMGLQGEDGFPHKATVNFVNNQVSPTTGSIAVRGVFPNPKPANGVRIFSPGMFVRVRLPIGLPHPALLVIDRAIGSDQGLKFVYVLGADNQVEYRRITTGPLQENGLRVISSGLKEDEWVVVGGLQRVGQHVKIQPEEEPMPTLAAQAPTEGP